MPLLCEGWNQAALGILKKLFGNSQEKLVSQGNPLVRLAAPALGGRFAWLNLFRRLGKDDECLSPTKRNLD